MTPYHVIFWYGDSQYDQYLLNINQTGQLSRWSSIVDIFLFSIFFAIWCYFPYWTLLPLWYFFRNKSILKIYEESHVSFLNVLGYYIFGTKFSQMRNYVRTINNGSGFSFRGQFWIKIKSYISHSIETVNSVKCYILIEQLKTGGVCWWLDRFQKYWLYNRLAELICFFSVKLCFHQHEWIVILFVPTQVYQCHIPFVCNMYCAVVLWLR